MPEVLFAVDQSRSFFEQDVLGHNRFHPDIPAVATVRPDSEFRLECREWFDGTVGNNDSADDVRSVDLSIVHGLSGPIAVEGAEPGDLLIVDVLDLGPVPQAYGPVAGQGWGYTGIFARDNGGGFLTDHFPAGYKAVWDFHGMSATSRHLPGVRFTGLAHPGILATAPSADLLTSWNSREQALIDTAPDAVPPLALPPNAQHALVGGLTGSDAERAAREGARTVPPRENGGNQDIKNLSRGSRAYFPVFVRGGNLSAGDLHFSQGDGEITFCGAIEMGGYLDLHVDLIKGGMAEYGISSPVFMPGNLQPQHTEFLTFVGLSVGEDGTQHHLDSQLAYRNACLHAIEYLTKFGYSGEQAYLLLGAVPIEGRFSGVVDVPNACATVYLPLDVFDFDLRPSAGGPSRAERGSCAS